MNQFVHLNVKSEYSLLNGAARIQQLVKRAADLGMPALALTDRDVMYGAIAFYAACMEHRIKPIIGCELTIATEAMFRITLLAKHKQGYQNLMALCSKAQLSKAQLSNAQFSNIQLPKAQLSNAQQHTYERPAITKEQLRDYAEGIVCLSGGMNSDIAHDLLRGEFDMARAKAEQYKAIFGEDFYLEMQDHSILEQKKLNEALIQLSEQVHVPLVATNDVHYVSQDDHIIQDTLLCIGTGHRLEDDERYKLQTDEYYLKSGEQMAKQFVHVPEAVHNTIVIAEKCQLELTFGQSILPEYEPLPPGVSAPAYLRSLCEAGLLERYEQSKLWEQSDYRDKALQRLDYELNVIESMGFSNYFLIVWDFIRYAHEQGIRVGPGRGSSAGSLVAYVLHITDVDPIRYRLLFERFLNPERISMPDIDIDFDDERRDEVIQYVVDKYGADRVAQIITFGTMAARAALRDVGRVLDMPLHEVDKAAKMVPNRVGMTIEKALQLNPDLQQFANESQQNTDFIKMALKIEGYPRHASTHAAGVVISREPLTHYVPLQEGTEGVALTQYSMDHLETIGLLKMDFLGLRTLSIIERALQWIEQHEGVVLDFKQLGDSDKRTYEMISRGDTLGIFQLESAGMRRVLKELKPTQFEDIISVLALYRPGPMEFIPQYIAGKHGRIEVTYPHPSLEHILSETYGIIVYQEQIMQIAYTMAGFSLGEADLLRRAVSKKERAVLDEERDHFVKGSIEQGHTEEDAHKVYDMIVRFADYGFPRAHAAAYGVLAYQTAYLKANYPVYFMASMLTAVRGSQLKVAQYVAECRAMNIPVLPPDVNESGILFEPISPEVSGHPFGAIRFGMSGIKNVGTLAMQALIEARQEAPFESLLDLCRRVDLKVCNKRVIESLIQGGALDSLPGHRAQLLAMLDEVIEAALKWKKERDELQISMFGLSERINWTINYPEIRPFGSMEQLQLEREQLGLYISGHPLDEYEVQMKPHQFDLLHELNEYDDDRSVRVVGMIVAIRTILTKRGKRMAFVELEDRITKVEVVIFPSTWEQCHDWLEQGSLIMLQAKIQQEEEAVKLLAQHLRPLDEALQHMRPVQHKSERNTNSTVYVKITEAHERADVLVDLKALLLKHKGEQRVILYYERTQRSLALAARYHVNANDQLIKAVERLLGEGSIKVRA